MKDCHKCGAPINEEWRQEFKEPKGLINSVSMSSHECDPYFLLRRIDKNLDEKMTDYAASAELISTNTSPAIGLEGFTGRKNIKGRTYKTNETITLCVDE